jgi:hypothetical protein
MRSRAAYDFIAPALLSIPDTTSGPGHNELADTTVSEEMRRTYGRTTREFPGFAGMKHPSEAVPDDAASM